jgi:DNA polymerase III subunit epsilon
MLRNLFLTRPLAAIDTETTGLLEDDARIVEIAVIRVEPDLSVQAIVRRLNPGIPIPPAATAVHRITSEHVATCPGFADCSAAISELLGGCDLCGFNLLGFDLPVLDGERRRAGLAPFDMRGRQAIDVMRLFHSFLPPGRHGRPERGTGTLDAASLRYLRSSGIATHGALCDAIAALRILDAMVVYHRLPSRFAELAALAGHG